MIENQRIKSLFFCKIAFHKIPCSGDLIIVVTFASKVRSMHTKLNRMKKLFFLFFSIAAISACGQMWGERVSGNGNMKTEERTVGSFSGIGSSGSFDVELSFGKPGSIRIEAEENLLEYIETKVENDVLMIRFRKNININHRKKITVYTSLTKMSKVALSGSGNVRGAGDFGNDGNTEFKVSGSGDIDIAFDRIRSSEVSISGSGKIILKGRGESVDIRISGSGNADCEGLIVDDAKVSISGSGNTRVNTNRSLEANISGSGNISYKGAATDIVKRTAGSGRVSKI
ncbi:MAG: hypothetical protein RL596_734 [Bacteroidota bacterium]|jgi:hypothetical protein